MQPDTHYDASAKVEDVNPNEALLASTGRHSFGLFVIFLQAILALALAFGLILPFAGDAFESVGLSRGVATAFTALFSLAAIVLVILYIILAARIYRANRIIITNDNVTQITQVGLFHRRISEISMGNVEDVSVRQKGIFQTVFNFGQLHIETAGEQNNYDFVYCPNPGSYAKVIQDARLKFIKSHGE